MQVKQSKTNWLLDLCLLTIGIALFFSLFLGSIPLGVPDEARYAEIPREMLALRDYITPHLNGVKYFEKPVLFYWLQAGAMRLFGLEEWAVRLPNALFGLLGCLITYAAGRALFDRLSGWLASVILATSVLYFGMAHIVTIDMTFSVLVSASLFCFLTASQATMHKRWLCYGGYACAALAVLAKGLVGCIFPGAIIFFWLLLLNQWRLLKVFYLPTGILIFLIIVLPWHILAQIKNPEFLQFYFIDQHFLRYFTQEAGRYKPFWFFIPVLLAGFLPWISFLPQAVHYHWPRKQLALQKRQVYAFLLIWPGLIFIFFSFSNSKLVTYLLPVFPALALLTGHYLAENYTLAANLKGLKYGYIIMPVLLGLLLIIALTGVNAHLFKQDLLHLMPAILRIGAVWMFGSLIALAFFYREKLLYAFACTAGFTALALVLLLSRHTMLDLGSIKPLAQTLKPLLNTGATVASYETYYQDLPYYLRQKVTVVDWRGELKFGMQHQDTSAWMINQAQFWRLWQSPRRVFVLMPVKDYERLKAASGHSFYLIQRHTNNVLLTNHPL